MIARKVNTDEMCRGAEVFVGEALQLLLSLVAASPSAALAALKEVLTRPDWALERSLPLRGACKQEVCRVSLAYLAQAHRWTGYAARYCAGIHVQEHAMHEIFASNLQAGLAAGRTAARKILARMASQVRPTPTRTPHPRTCVRPLRSPCLTL